MSQISENPTGTPAALTLPSDGEGGQVRPLLMHKKTGNVYQHDGELKFTNLTTGASGELSPEIAQKYFVVSIRLNVMANENPEIIELIQKLGLTVNL